MNKCVFVADVSALNDEEIFKKNFKKVSADRQSKIDKLKNLSAKCLSLGAGLLLQKAVNLCGITDDNPLIDYNEYGKPFFSQYPDIHFNLSHSGTFVVCSISNYDIGIDIERIDSFNKDLYKLSKRFFHEDEHNYIIDRAKKFDTENIFFRLWTLKESFIKANGKGFSIAPNSFCINLNDKPISVTQNFDSNAYYFREYDDIPGYKLSVCGLDPDISGKNSQNNLINKASDPYGLTLFDKTLFSG